MSSDKVVITDPGYDESTARDLGDCFVDSCAIGKWNVELTEDIYPDLQCQVPRRLLAALDGFQSFQDPRGWKRVGEVGGDTGILGVFDLSHFHDIAIVPSGQVWTYDDGPADSNDLWYSLVCEAIRDKVATVIPHGFVVSWDASMDVDVFYSERRVVGIRLSIF